MNFNSRNREGYPDPTFNEALYNITKEERQAKRRAERKAANSGKGRRAYKKNTVDGQSTDRKELIQDDTERAEDKKTLGELPLDA